MAIGTGSGYKIRVRVNSVNTSKIYIVPHLKIFHVIPLRYEGMLAGLP